MIPFNEKADAYRRGCQDTIRDLAAELRDSYPEDVFPCDSATLAQVNRDAGENATARVAAHMMRHWAGVLGARVAEVASHE